ncbi:MAG: type IV secretion system protein VirB10 [Novosphingobium sp.]
MSEEVMSVPGDRDAVGADAALARSRGTVNRKIMPVLFGAGIVGGGIITTLLILSAHAMIWPAQKEPEQKAGTARTVSEQQAMQQDAAFKALNGGIGHASGQPLTPGQTALAGGQPVNTFGNPQAPVPTGGAGTPKLSRAQQLAIASQRAPIMGYAGGLGGGFTPQGQNGGAPQMGAPMPGPLVGGQGGPQGAGGFVTAPVSASGDLGGQLTRSKIEVARATIIGDRNFLVAAGRTIPCTLQTAINSTQAGIVSCIIGQDIYSENGRVVMLDKGTKVLGQYTGGVRQGQARLFVVWTRALTPRGVAIDLGSPASDELGRAGIGGGVDTQFWQRFGAALMFSVLEDAASVASTHFAGIGTNSTQVPANTASAALNGSQNVQPILKANQGQTVAIQVARDYDFGTVYDVRIKQPQAGR